MILFFCCCCIAYTFHRAHTRDPIAQQNKQNDIFFPIENWISHKTKFQNVLIQKKKKSVFIIIALFLYYVHILKKCIVILSNQFSSASFVLAFVEFYDQHLLFIREFCCDRSYTIVDAFFIIVFFFVAFMRIYEYLWVVLRVYMCRMCTKCTLCVYTKNEMKTRLSCELLPHFQLETKKKHTYFERNERTQKPIRDY